MSNTKIPSSVLLQFFEDATKSLRDMKGSEGIENSCNGYEGNNYLDHHRKNVLDVQVQTLQRIILDYNSNISSDEAILSIDQVQTALRKMGSKGEEIENEGEDNPLNEAMVTMNAEARQTFTRLVLQEQLLLSTQHENESIPRVLKDMNEEGMQIQDVIDFCALCASAVTLPGVKKYLKYGGSLLDDKQYTLNEGESETDLSSEVLEERIGEMQNLFYNAVGFTATHGTNEMRRILRTPTEIYVANSNSPEKSQDLVLALKKFIAAMNDAMNDALGNTQHYELDDTKEGGCTKVVSVKYSEFDDDDPKHISSVMEEHVEQQQMHELEVARQAASLHQSILGELLTMEEEEREQMLSQAKKSHDSFMEKASKLPIGPERVQFLRTVSEDTQRMLLMHKLWEKMLADHKGEAPQDRRAG